MTVAVADGVVQRGHVDRPLPGFLGLSGGVQRQNDCAAQFPSAAANHDSAIRSCGPNSATCRPKRVRSSATILAPGSARPSAQ